MTPDPYRVAYDAALAEIAEIAGKFEQLRTRKVQIENLIGVLQPMVPAEGGGSEAASAVSAPAPDAASEEAPAAEVASAPEASEAESELSYSYLNVPNPLPEGDGDPFQRRMRSSFRFRGLAAQRSY